MPTRSTQLFCKVIFKKIFLNDAEKEGMNNKYNSEMHFNRLYSQNTKVIQR